MFVGSASAKLRNALTCLVSAEGLGRRRTRRSLLLRRILSEMVPNSQPSCRLLHSTNVCESMCRGCFLFQDESLLTHYTAPVVFNQIDVLSLPGAGLRHLDFPSDVQSMFAELFTGQGSQPTVPMEPTPPPPTIPRVRAYGSESEMWALRPCFYQCRLDISLT